MSYKDFESDTKILKWLRDNMEWDGHGYWLPDVCIREIEHGEAECKEPSMKEFREILSARMKRPTTVK